jgi:hypothetical protein
VSECGAAEPNAETAVSFQRQPAAFTSDSKKVSAIISLIGFSPK